MQAPNLLDSRLWTRFSKPSMTTTLVMLGGTVAAVSIVVVTCGMAIAGALF